MEERSGPVLSELPEDIAGEEAEEVAMVAQHPIEIPVAHRASSDRAADMNLKAKRPLIMLGVAARGLAGRPASGVRPPARKFHSSRRKWGREPYTAVAIPIWGRPRSANATKCMKPSIVPT
jgi:hypothetical protein